jgi:dienelactone hydrolase
MMVCSALTFSTQANCSCCLGPIFLSCAENDVAFDSASRRKAVDILQSGKKTYHVHVISGVEHGFALKGDIANPFECRYLRNT